MAYRPRALVLLRALLLAGSAAAALSGVARAEETPAPAPPPADDGLGDGGFYLEADSVVQDEARDTVTATGSVEARYDGRTLRAEEVTYDPKTGQATASGHVQIIQADGSAQFADAVTLDDKFRAGIALGFSARLKDNVKIAAASAVRRSETIDELNYMIFTPCETCAEQPKPTWSIKARRAVRDQKRRLIYYRDAVIEVRGVPVFYAPVFWHPDPTAERTSGLLTPRAGISNRRGVSIEPRYLWVLSPSQDLTAGLQLNSRVNPLLNLQYRKRFYSGDIDLRAGYTYEEDIGRFDKNGDGLISGGEKNTRFGEAQSRSFILGDGLFDIDENWRWGFTAERTSDPLLFDKYDTSDVYDNRRGLFKADDRRLISQLYTERQDSRSYLSAAVVSIQGLRTNDRDSTFPLVAPLIEARWEPDFAILGGRVRLRGSAVALTRDTDPVNSSLDGLDSRRATAEIDWRGSYTFRNGMRVEPFAHGRVDLYSLSDRPGPVGADTDTRALGDIGADLSWPFFRVFGDKTVVLEPLVQVVASPAPDPVVVGRTAGGDPIYLNEDSVVFDFDETNLFRANKSPGYDLYESGVRANVGGRATVTFADGRQAGVLVGRSFRDQQDDSLPVRTGLRETSSDWIVSGYAQPLKQLSLFAGARLDDETGEAHRLEAGAAASFKRVSGSVRYVKEDQNSLGVPAEDLTIDGQVLVTRHWGAVFRGIHDFEDDTWRRQEYGLVYEDDCTRLEVVYARDDTFNRTLGPSESLNVRLTLATLGSTR